MKIKWFGHSFFTISQGKFTIAIDPYSPEIGITPPQIDANFCAITHNHPGHNNKEVVTCNRFLDWPGEYEIAEVLIEAFSFFHEPKDSEKNLGDTLVFIFDYEGERFCHLGDIGCKLTPEMIEKIGDIDVLFVPVGGENTIDSKKAKEVISSLDPKFTIPMHYKTDGIKKDLEPIDKFLKEMGIEQGEFIEEFDTKKAKSVGDKTEVVLLEISK